jgi:hypothetical protein
VRGDAPILRAITKGGTLEIVAIAAHGDGTATVPTRERRMTVTELERATPKLMAKVKRRGATERPKAA